MIQQRPNFEFTVGMALEDFIPVILTTVGLYFLLKVIIRHHRNLCPLACLGATLIITDGFLKATWKLIYAASGIDVTWMKDTLFLLMGPGFIFVAWAFWRALKHDSNNTKQTWLIPLIVVIPSLILSFYLAATREGRAWARVLLSLTTIGILMVNGMIISNSLKGKLFLPVTLLIINIITIFGQAFISQLPQTTDLHWIGQINNTISWGAFALGVWMWQKKSS